MSSFNILEKDYNIIQQNEKNKEVIRENQQETGEILQENIPADELEVEEDIDKGPAEEPEEPDDGSEINKFINFLDRVIFQLKGMRGYGKPQLLKEMLGL